VPLVGHVPYDATVEGTLAMKGIPDRELLGKLLYLVVATRPDFSYAVGAGVLCCFMENPGMPHWEVGKRILCYLRGTTSLSPVYSSPPSPVHRFATCRLKWQLGHCYYIKLMTRLRVFHTYNQYMIQELAYDNEPLQSDNTLN